MPLLPKLHSDSEAGLARSFAGKAFRFCALLVQVKKRLCTEKLRQLALAVLRDVMSERMAAERMEWLCVPRNAIVMGLLLAAGMFTGFDMYASGAALVLCGAWVFLVPAVVLFFVVPRLRLREGEAEVEWPAFLTQLSFDSFSPRVPHRPPVSRHA